MKIINRLTVLLKTKPWFLFSLPVFFIFSGYNELFGFLPMRFVFLNLAVTLLSVFFVFLLSFLLLRNKEKAAVVTILVALPMLTFGYIHDSIKHLQTRAFFISFSFLIPTLALLLLFFFFLIKRRKKPFTEFFLFMNVLFLILILSEIPNSIKRYQLDKSVHNLIDFRFSAFNDYRPEKEIQDSSKPDIFFLVFDAMASSKSVQKTTGRNINSLDSFLQQKGFYLATDAAANYNWTIHSVSTTFNMEYLPPWITPVKDDLKVYFWGSSSIKDNSLFRILDKEGYRIKSYQPISFNNPDWPGDSYFTNLRKYHYYFKTLPGRIYRDIFWNYARIDLDFIKKRQYKLMQKRGIEKKRLLDTTIALIKSNCSPDGHPKFIYGHFMIPHDPYVFDSSGNLKPLDKTIVRTTADDLRYYFEQLQYASNVIEDLVTYIQTHNKKNSIIIIAGDHGFKTKDARAKGYTFNNYSAYYFPDKQYESMYKSASPVNTFRLVLNKYFAAKLPLLKDSSTLVKQDVKETIKKSEKIQPTHTPSSPNQ